MLAMKLRTANSAGVAVWAANLHGLPRGYVVPQKHRKSFTLYEMPVKYV
jgi:hypothetical protein